jgi:hypothetical protein
VTVLDAPRVDTIILEDAINEAFTCARCATQPVWYVNCAHCHRNDALLCDHHLKFDEATIVDKIRCGACDVIGYFEDVFSRDPI